MTAGACLGCGEPLSPRSTRGRRARYHGAACRQRARRARLHVERGRTWEALERADTAMVAARRAMAASGDPQEAIRSLVSAVAELAELHDIAPSCSEPAAWVDISERRVTEPVTKQFTVSVTDDPARPSAEREDPATAAMRDAPKGQLPQPIGPREKLDVDTVRLERAQQPRTWTVLAGHGDGERLVGFVRPHGIKQKQWEAFSPGWVRVLGGPWRTRQDAMIRLIDPHVPRCRMR